MPTCCNGTPIRRTSPASRLHRQIERQAAERPRATAVVYGERALDYGELNLRANRLAHRLIELGVGPDVLVGLAAERSLEMIVGLLAILGPAAPMSRSIRATPATGWAT